MDWIKLTGKTEYAVIQRSALVMYHLAEHEVVLIDAGGSESAEFLEDLARRGLQVRAVLLTHLHPDHTGNAAAVYKLYHSEIFISGQITPPVWCRLQGCSLSRYPDVGPLTIDGEVFGTLPTPGHSPDHVCLVTPDGVCCIGDAMMTPNMVKHSKAPYMENCEQAIQSMELLRQTSYPIYLAAHEGVIRREELSSVIDQNIQKELDIQHALKTLVTGPISAEELVTQFLTTSGVRIKFVLESPEYRATVHARIKSLIDAGELRSSDGMIFRSEQI